MKSAQQTTSEWRLRLRQQWPVVLCVGVGLVLTWGTHELVDAVEKRAAKTRFHKEAENRLQAMQREFDETITKVQSLQTLFTAKPDLTETEFEYAVSRIRGSSKSTWVFEWAPRVERVNKGTLEAKMRARGFPGYTVEATPPGMNREVETLYPLEYISPSTNSGSILGLHFGPRREGDTPSQARDRGVTTASPPYVLLEDRGKAEQLSMAVYAPVYRFGSNIDTTEGRRESIVGYVICAIRIGELVEHAMAALAPAGMNVHIDDLNTKAGAKRVHTHRTRVALDSGNSKVVFRREQAIAIGGREWRVSFEGYMPQQTGGTTLWLATMLPMILLVGAMAWITYLGTKREPAAKPANDENPGQLGQSEARGRSAAELKTQVLADIGNTLLTPLNGILGSTELLKAAELTERGESLRGTVESCGKQMLAMLRNLIELTNLERGQFRTVRGEFSPRETLEGVVQMYRGAAEAKRLKLQIRVGEPVPETLIGDPERVGQLVAILLSNAIQYTDRGSVQVEVDGIRGERFRLRIVVTDTGPGMAAELKERLFVRFATAEIGMSRKREGMGIGLSLAKQIVDAIGGKIGCSSEVGKGSRFWVEIPFDRSKAERLVPATEKKLTILVVDDNAVNRQVVGQMLKRLGHTVEMCRNGLEAVDHCSTNLYDLVLMDCMMPLMDGFAATEALRSEGSKVPILALTAMTTAEDRQRCFDSGMDDHIGKPIDLMQLESAIAKWAVQKAEEPR